MSRRDRMLGLGILVVVIVVGLVVLNRPPAIPAGAAGAPLEQTNATDGHGARCLDRLQLGSGWADVCWAVDQIPDGSDNTQDTYKLRVYGTYQGLRWLVARADLIGRPDGGAYVTWPKGVIEGDCRQMNVHLLPMIGVEPTEVVCGRTVGEQDSVGWASTLTWTCELCLLPDGADKSLSLYAIVAVPPNTIPGWDLSVAGGG